MFIPVGRIHSGRTNFLRIREFVNSFMAVPPSSGNANGGDGDALSRGPAMGPLGRVPGARGESLNTFEITFGGRLSAARR